MKKSRSFLPVLFAVVMLFCVLFVICYLPAVSSLRFRLEDAEKSLETSRGRERKQQYEYDEAVAAIPEVQAELDRIIPLNEQAKQELQDLKAERKRLREEKKELEKQAKQAAEQEVKGHE